MAIIVRDWIERARKKCVQYTQCIGSSKQQATWSMQQSVDEMNTENTMKSALEFLYVNNFKFVFSHMLFLLFLLLVQCFDLDLVHLLSSCIGYVECLLILYETNIYTYIYRLLLLLWAKKSKTTQKKNIFFSSTKRINVRKRGSKKKPNDITGVEKSVKMFVCECACVFIDATNVRFLRLSNLRLYVIW